jgi:hypothetical protein
VRRGQQNQRLLDTGLRRYDGFFEVFHVFQHPAKDIKISADTGLGLSAYAASSPLPE